MTNSSKGFMHVANPSSVKDLSPLLLDEKGKLRPVPASVLAETTVVERALFGMRHAVYGLLTNELLGYLKEVLGNKSAIEVGAGHGQLARYLGIPATDNRQQEWPEVAAYYRLMGQPVIQYGDNVERIDAISAAKKYQPDIVVGSWITHRYDPLRHEAGGNQDGVDEQELLNHCGAYLFVGNREVHKHKAIWTEPHEIIEPSWLYSRAHNGSPDFIAIWKGRKR